MVDGTAVALLFVGIAAAFTVNVLSFAFARRLWPPVRRGTTHFLSALLALASWIIYAAIVGVPNALVIPGLAMAACNAYVLFHLDNMGETARRIRILRELEAAPGGLTRQAILQAYTPREVFELRIRRLKLAGQCVEENGRLRMRGGMYSAMGSLVAFGRRLVFGKAQKAGEEAKL